MDSALKSLGNAHRTKSSWYGWEAKKCVGGKPETRDAGDVLKGSTYHSPGASGRGVLLMFPAAADAKLLGAIMEGRI